MLSIDECRRILGIPELTDEQNANIHDTLVVFAHTLIDQFVRERREGAEGESVREPSTTLDANRNNK